MLGISQIEKSWRAGLFSNQQSFGKTGLHFQDMHFLILKLFINHKGSVTLIDSLSTLVKFLAPQVL